MGKSTKVGTHIDFTTLLGAVDALQLIPETRNLPITFSHLLSLAQFIDSIVLHHQVFFENSDLPQHEHYDAVIRESTVEQILDRDVLVPHQNPLVDDDFKYAGIQWALSSVTSVSPDAFLYSVMPRESHYRAMELRKNIQDQRNPFTEDVFDTARREGGARFARQIDDVLSELEARNIGRMGLHVMFRLYHLDEWLTGERGISYHPNFSRNPLIEQTLVRRKRPLDFMRWAVREVGAHRQRLVAELATDDEFNETMFDLSPVFLRCLTGSNQPRDVLEKAMTLRKSKEAKGLRKVYGKLSALSTPGEDRTLQLRSELGTALTEFNGLNSEKGTSSVSASAGVDATGPKVGVSVTKTMKDGGKHPNTAFFIDTLDSSRHMVDVMEAVEHVFGAVSTEDQWILSRRAK